MSETKECSTCVFRGLSLDDFPCNKCDSDYSEFANHETIAELQSTITQQEDVIRRLKEDGERLYKISYCNCPDTIDGHLADCPITLHNQLSELEKREGNHV